MKGSSCLARRACLPISFLFQTQEKTFGINQYRGDTLGEALSLTNANWHPQALWVCKIEVGAFPLTVETAGLSAEYSYELLSTCQMAKFNKLCFFVIPRQDLHITT